MKYTALLIFFIGFAATFIIKNVEGSQFNYLVSLQNSRGQHVCSGGIVSDNFVITAAHCVLDGAGQFNSDRLTVVAGTDDVSSGNSAVKVPVEKAYVLDEYKPRKGTPEKPFRTTADIAGLKLKSGLGIGQSSNVGKLEFPKEPFYTYYEDTAVVAGYGLSSGSIGKVQSGKVFILVSDNCGVLYSRELRQSNVCAKPAESDANDRTKVCAGDSGSPLVIGENTIIGVQYESPAGCQTEGKEYFTRITYYLHLFIGYVLNGKHTGHMRIATWGESNSFTVHSEYPYDINEEVLIYSGK